MLSDYIPRMWQKHLFYEPVELNRLAFQFGYNKFIMSAFAK